MRTLLVLSPLLVGAALLAQNAAPVQNDVKTHVSPADAKTATDQAARARSSPADAPAGQERVLDSVVAIVNGDVLLESDVEEEQRLESLQPVTGGENTIVRAAQHLITRTLILQQMKAQQETSAEVTDAAVAKTVDLLRKDLPGCAAAHCDTAAGWAAFLQARGLSPEEVTDRWRQRLVILDYLNLRFRSGIRIPKADIQKYYEATLVPEFQKKNQKAPTLKSLTSRIEEVLLQEQVSKQIDDWEATLRQQGSVQILVPAYGQSTNNNDDDAPGGEA